MTTINQSAARKAQTSLKAQKAADEIARIQFQSLCTQFQIHHVVVRLSRVIVERRVLVGCAKIGLPSLAQGSVGAGPGGSAEPLTGFGLD